MADNKPSQSIQEKKPGFFYGYIIVLISFLIMMIVWGAQYSFGVFFKPLLNEFGWTRAAISGAYSVNMILYGFFGIITGKLSDRFGSRLVVTLGGLLIGLSYLLMSQIHDIWQIYVLYGVLLSIGSAGIFVPLASNVARWFHKGRGLASGIMVSGVGIGIALMPPLATQLISNYSWQTSYIIIGFGILVIVGISAQFLKREPTRIISFDKEPEALKTTNLNVQEQGFSTGDAIRSRQFWIICILGFVGAAYVQTIIVHLVPYATDAGISPSDAAILLSTIGWISIGSKIGLGRLGDRYGNRRAFIVVFVSLLVAFLCLQLGRELWMLSLFTVVFAIGYGGSVALLSPIVAEYFGLMAHGVILGLLMFITNLGSAIGPLIAGGIFDISGSYFWAFMFCAMLSVIGLVLSMVLKAARK